MKQFEKDIILLTIHLLDEVYEIVKDLSINNRIEFLRAELLNMVS